MKSQNLKKLAGCGGCTAKLSPGKLKDVLTSIPKFHDDNLLIGFESSDDGAVYRLSDDIAIIKTLDFFPPMVEDPYTFGKIAAANSLSDIYAMGGEVKLALNIVCFPERDDLAILGEILRGGAEKVLEAGGVLCGGHSINDISVKYGLSVTGVVHPKKILANNTLNIGDSIILTKPLGVGIIMARYTVYGEETDSFIKALSYMETLNKYPAEIMKNFAVSACTDVTGFGFLGHLNEMATNNYTISVLPTEIPYIKDAYGYAEEFIITAGGQKNRKFLKDNITCEIDDEPLMEIMYDPQTSGGLLIGIKETEKEDFLAALKEKNILGKEVAKVVPREQTNIIIRR